MNSDTTFASHESLHEVKHDLAKELLFRRIMFVVSEKPSVLQGMERQSVRIASGIQDRGAFIAFACPKGGVVDRAAKKNGIETVSYDLKNSMDMHGAWILSRALNRYNIDIVHVHARRDFFPSVMAIIFLCLSRFNFRTRPRLILHSHQISSLARPSLTTRLLFTWITDRVYGVSNAVSSTIEGADSIVPASIVKTLYNGVDIERFTFSNEEKSFFRKMYREQLGISDDAPVIGMVGRINDKGQDRILELMPDLLKTLPNLKVVMVGPSKNARETVESFRKRVAALDLCESVIVTGPAHENASEIMNAFDCMVHLPDYEAFGLVLPEAGAEGLPVIASNVGGIPEVVKDKVTGIIVDRDDTNAIISAILTLFDPIDGEEKRRRMGESGRARAIDLFSLQASIDQILEDYKLLNKREK